MLGATATVVGDLGEASISKGKCNLKTLVGNWIAIEDVMVEAEVEESAQVDRCGAVSETDAVAFDAAEPDATVVVRDEPCDGAFDHGPVLSVVVEADPVGPVGPGGGEEFVVFGDVEPAAVDGGGAA